jgi:hypothetical protein
MDFYLEWGIRRTAAQFNLGQQYPYSNSVEHSICIIHQKHEGLVFLNQLTAA